MKLESIKYVVINFCLIFLIGCQDSSKDVTHRKTEDTTHVNESSPIGDCADYLMNQKSNNLNISILLDLSDRIEQSKIQKKDSAYLSLVSKAFVNHVKRKKLILLHDQIQLFFNPEPSDEKINAIAETLRIKFDKESPKNQIENVVSLYSEKPTELYNLAKIEAVNAGHYPGADIWRFFKDNVKDYCMSNCHRNVLVVLTDGYMYYDGTIMNESNKSSFLTPKSLSRLGLNTSNWKSMIDKQKLGFIPATSDLDNLEVLVIGINSLNEKNPYAMDIIDYYWEQWLDQMGVKSFKIKHADIPSSLEKVIYDFIDKK